MFVVAILRCFFLVCGFGWVVWWVGVVVLVGLTGRLVVTLLCCERLVGLI